MLPIKTYICTLLISICFSTVFTQSSQATDLLQAYKLALATEPEWSAERAKFLAERESEKMGFSGLLPQVNFSASYANSTYEVARSGSPKFSDLLGVDIIDAVDCLVGESSSTPNITACNEASRQANNASFAVSKTGFNITQPLFRLDRWYAYKRSQDISDRGHATYLKAQQDLIIRVAETYFNTLRTWEHVEFSRREEMSLKKQLNTTINRYKKGLVTSTDVYEAQAISDLAQSSRFSSENAFRGAIEDLEQITLLPGIEINPLPEDLPIELPQPADPEAWVEAATSSNLDIKIAQYTAAAARKNHRLERSNHAPTVDLVASYSQQNSAGRTSTNDEGDSDQSSLAISLNLPLYTGGAISARERKAKYKMREAEYRQQQTLHSVSGATRKTYRNVVTSVKKITALQVAIASNKKALKAVEKGYLNGARHVAEVLQASRDLFKAQQEHSNARYEYIINTLRLKRASGVLTETDLHDLNDWLAGNKASITTSNPRPQHIDAFNPSAREPRDAYELNNITNIYNKSDNESYKQTHNQNPPKSPTDTQPKKSEQKGSLFKAIKDLRNK